MPDLVPSLKGTEPGGQSYRERLPASGLRQFVSCVWIHSVSSGSPGHEHRTAPNGCVEIAFDTNSGVIHLIGTQRAPVVGTLPAGATTVGIRFRPGVAPAVLRVSAADLADVRVPLQQLFGRIAGVFGERASEAPTPGGAAAVLEQWVLARCLTASDPDPAVMEAVRRLQPWRAGSVDQLTSDLLMSARQLRRRFGFAFGFGPKAVQRILRFQGFLALSNTVGDGRRVLARLAADAGYADQAHLSRECSRLTGLSPKAFLAELERTCRLNHDHRASFSPLSRMLLAGRPDYAEEGEGSSFAWRRRSWRAA